MPAFSNNYTELLVTVATLGSFLPSSMLMSLYLTSFKVEAVSELLKLCSFFPSVCTLFMYLVTASCKRAPTLSALIRFFPSVYPHMSL